MDKRNIKIDRLIEWALPWIVLSILGTYSYAYFLQVPYLGFDFFNGRVTDVFTGSRYENSLQVDDQIISIGHVLIDYYNKDLRKTLLNDVVIEDTIPIEVFRNGQIISIEWVIPDSPLEEFLDRVVDTWWIAYVFWLAGSATIVFHRPKDGHWKRMIAFYYLTAVWLAAGSRLSGWHVWQSAIVLRSAIWLCLPVYLHFHWGFPKPIRKLPKLVWMLLYFVGILMVILEWFQFISPDTFLYGFAVAYSGSVLILISHIILQPDERRKLIPLILAVGLISIPLIKIASAYLAGLYPFENIRLYAFLTLPTLPGFYFFSSYWDQLRSLKHHVNQLVQWYIICILLCVAIIVPLSLIDLRYGLENPSFNINAIIIILISLLTTISFAPFFTIPALAETTVDLPSKKSGMQIRANRAVSIFLFEILLGSLLSIALVLGNVFFNFKFANIFIGVVSSLSAIFFTSLGYPKFQRFIEHRLLRIDLVPAQLIETYAERITTSLDLTNLISILKDAILPTLLIRQSALLQLKDDNYLSILYSTGVEDTQIPQSLDYFGQLSHQNEFFTSVSDFPDTNVWYRILIPLTINNKIVGVWLLGSKDPDDVYKQGEITILKSIANQTAIAIANIEQQENVRNLYKENIHRHEEERGKLARDLHDEILNGLAVLGMTLEDDQISPEFEEHYKILTNRIRRMISGLRPPTLDQGLWFALNELVNEFRQRIGENTSIRWDVSPSNIRYEPILEGHIFRIIQQSCENAIQHAHAENIRVSGELIPDRVYLCVEDDGIGFNLNQIKTPNPEDKIHYGLTVMRERAELIGADLDIHTKSGHGTQVELILNRVLYRQSEHQARIEAEKALRQSKGDIKTLLDSANDGIFMADEKYKIIYANKTAALISGYSQIELLNKNINELTKSTEIEFIKNDLMKMLKGETLTSEYEATLQKKDGTSVPVLVIASRTVWQGKPAGMAIIRNISGRKEVEKALEERESSFITILENVNDGIILVDDEGKIIYTNSKASAISGYRMDELNELNINDFEDHQSGSNLWANLTEQIVGNQSRKRFETILKRKDGVNVLVNINAIRTDWKGQTAGLIIFQDVSDRKQWSLH